MDNTTHGASIPASLSATPGRPAGVVLLALAVAMLGLLHNHPSSAAQTFAEMLRDEAAHRVVDAVVHGGFIVVLAAQFTCLAILAARIGLRRPSVIVALVMTAIGSGALMVSLAADGLIVPAIAARYLPLPERQDEARAIVALLGTLIGFAMPGGILFQATGLVAWGAAVEGRASLLRVLRWSGVVGGAAIVVAVTATAGAQPVVWMLAIVAFAMWFALAGWALVRGVL